MRSIRIKSTSVRLTVSTLSTDGLPTDRRSILLIRHHPRIPPAIHCEPDRPRMPKRQQRKHHAEPSQRSSQLLVGVAELVMQDPVGNQERNRGQSVVHIRRPEVVAGSPLKLQPATAASLVHAEESAEQFPLAAPGAAELHRPRKERFVLRAIPAANLGPVIRRVLGHRVLHWSGSRSTALGVASSPLKCWAITAASSSTAGRSVA